jgi:hypothetical protein
MVRAPILAIHDTSPNARYTLYTNASRFAVGDVLLQDQGIGVQPLAYHTRKMNTHEVHYLVHEQKLRLALRDALLTFRCYLDGAAGFTVITDHDTLRHFFRHHDLSTRHVRWLHVLAPYQRQMDIVYKKGGVNHADALSRRPDMEDSLHKMQLLRDWTNDEAKCELHAQIFLWNPGHIMTPEFMRKSKALVIWTNTCLPENLGLPDLYVNRMDSCTPTGQECMFRTFLHCDREYCTNYTTHQPRDIMVLLD